MGSEAAAGGYDIGLPVHSVSPIYECHPVTLPEAFRIEIDFGGYLDSVFRGRTVSTYKIAYSLLLYKRRRLCADWPTPIQPTVILPLLHPSPMSE